MKNLSEKFIKDDIRAVSEMMIKPLKTQVVWSIERGNMSFNASMIDSCLLSFTEL